MNFEVFDRIFAGLKSRLSQHPLQIKCYKKPTGKKYPLVVVREASNTSRNDTKFFYEKQSNIAIEINIYTTPMQIGGEYVGEEDVARIVMQEVSFVMEEYYGLKRVTCIPTPNIDETIYRVTMRYVGTISDYRNKIY